MFFNGANVPQITLVDRGGLSQEESFIAGAKWMREGIASELRKEEYRNGKKGACFIASDFAAGQMIANTFGDEPAEDDKQ